MALRTNRVIAASFVLVTAPSSTAWAHAFGARYDLPLPLWMFLAGAGLAVTLSFVVMALFVRARPAKAGGAEIVLSGLGEMCAMMRRPLQVASVGLFFLILATAVLGAESPIRNLAPVLVWVVWWVGYAIFTSFTGNTWPALNPWAVLYRLAVWRSGTRDGSGAHWTYPVVLAHWPSVGLFLAFAWLELVSNAGDSPKMLGWLIVGFSLLTWAGMAAFGEAVWRERCDPFERFFRLLGQFSPLHGNESVRLRPYGAGLARGLPEPSSLTAFVMVMLAIVTFDGFVETPAWAGVLGMLEGSVALRPVLLWVRDLGLDLLAVVKTVALLLFPFGFAAVYLVFSWLSARMAENRLPTSTVANALATSLVPIAIGYHVAHYLSYLLLAGQLAIPLASDPFGWGCDLFGTASYTMDITIINAKTVWYVAVAAIVLGHVAAVYAAHATARLIFADPRLALRSQLPMLALMVLYTMTSLWILSQPIVAD